MLDAVSQLAGYLVWNIGWVLGNEINPDPFGPN